jgi:hypothetical protein
LHCDTLLAPEPHVGGGGLSHLLEEAVQVWVIEQVAVPHLHCDTVLAPEPHVGGGGSAHVFDDAVHFCPLLHEVVPHWHRFSLVDAAEPSVFAHTG